MINPNSQSQILNTTRKVSGRFLVKYKLAPLEEADELFAIYQDFKQSLPTCLINEIQQYTFGKLDKTQLQLVYDPETKTIPNSHKTLFEDTVRFFKIDTIGQFQKWTSKNTDEGEIETKESRLQIALENVRFRATELAKEFKRTPIHPSRLLPCQLKPCLADIITILKLKRCNQFDRQPHFSESPWLIGQFGLDLTFRYKHDMFGLPAICYFFSSAGRSLGHVTSKDDTYGSFIESTRTRWTPENLVEFLHCLVPDYMNSPSSYELLGLTPNLAFANELKKRLPVVDWKDVDCEIAHYIRGYFERGMLVGTLMRPALDQVIIDIDKTHGIHDPNESDEVEFAIV
jgi:hypothetical protein